MCSPTRYIVLNLSGSSNEKGRDVCFKICRKDCRSLSAIRNILSDAPTKRDAARQWDHRRWRLKR